MCATLLAVVLAIAPPDTLETLLARGPLVSVEADGQGTFEAAIGFLDVEAPLERVWSVLTDVAKYKEYVPRVVESETKLVPGGARVKFEIESPGPNTLYTVQYALNPAAHVALGKQVSGDLKGSTWRWELFETAPGRTRVRYTSRARNFSSIVAALEDGAQTVTAGLNVGAAITMLRALKKRCEE
jgi:uncharacterized protein YndB with AHSA1/START domain